MPTATSRSQESSGPQPALSGHDSPLLADLQIDYGPVDVLGRFFLKAAHAARSRGVRLSFGSLEELARVNAEHRLGWSPLLPVFDPNPVLGHDSNAFCIIGRDSAGDVVASQAGRLFDLTGTTLAQAAQSLKLFYPALGSDQTAQKRCTVTAPAAHRMSGRVLYSGAGWYRPDFRSKQLSSVLPRISRAYGLARWNTTNTVSFIRKTLVDKGVAASYGYTNVQWAVTMADISSKDFDGALVWMDSEELVEDLSWFLRAFDAEIDPLVERRSA